VGAESGGLIGELTLETNEATQQTGQRDPHDYVDGVERWWLHGLSGPRCDQAPSI
jgi:hypothetical protein